MTNDGPGPLVQQSSSKQTSILLVEDEIMVRLALAEELRSRGYIVFEAVNAEEALSILNGEASIDLLITDLRMPGKFDGELLVKLARAKRPSMKVVVVSAHAEGSEAARVADAVFEKPYDLVQIVTRISTVLASSGTTTARPLLSLGDDRSKRFPRNDPRR